LHKKLGAEASRVVDKARTEYFMDWSWPRWISENTSIVPYMLL